MQSFLLLLTLNSLRQSWASSSPALEPNVYILVQQLAAASPTLPESELADLYRRLGKIQLDAREYAEAQRIFCHGSKLCPNDDKLRHHVKVHEAFHGEEEMTEDTTKDIDNPILPVPPPLTVSSLDEKPDLFLSLDVPPEVIPQAVKGWKGQLPPEARTRLIHASTVPILPKEACQYLIQSAMHTTNSIPWTKDRHVQAPTCDVPVFDLQPKEARKWCRQALTEALLPLLARQVAPELDIDSNQLRIQDCFIVRYDAADDQPGFDSLRPHEDESLLSLTIALNDQCEYEGGGLYIHATGDLLNGDAGTVLCFAGQLVHGGYPVTAGTRWILTVFLSVDANESGKPAGYTLDAIVREQERIRQE